VEESGGLVAQLRWVGLTLALMAMVSGLGAAPAEANFPYPTGINLPESSAYKLAPGVTPTNFSETGDWELSATPSTSSSSESTVDNQPDQLCGIRGISLVDADTTQPTGCVSGQPVKTAFQITTGNPDVHISVLDSGIEWNNPSVMANVADKIWLNTGELPAPLHDLSTPLAALPDGKTCASMSTVPSRVGDYNRLGNYWPNGHGGDAGGYYDVLHLGMVDVLDWACDSRVARALYPPSLNSGRTCPGTGCVVYPHYHGPMVGGVPVLTPEALILAFSDGKDHDHNGFANDIAGWNFVDNDNDPYDDVQYGHGSGEAQDSTAEADTGGTVGTCPNCMIMPLRVGESFVADANRFAEAALYATDMGSDVIQEALGTYNAPYFARQAIEYAYHHGTTVIASAADEAAEHHNQPGALPDAIVVNSVNEPEENIGPINATGNSYLELNGCTNWGPRVDLSVEGSSCSSESTGKSSGVTGLIYSAAEDALGAGRIKPSSDCKRVNGTPCIITPNEVRQLLASGNIKGDATAGQSTSSGSAPADQGDGGQADDVNFAQQPEPSCTSASVPSCTDPNLNFGTFNTSDTSQPGGVIGPDTSQYPARKGFDEFYGYGRLNAYKAVAAAADGHIPPEADITSPDWFTQIDPRQPSFNLDGYVNGRVAYTCRVDIAPGAEPNNALATAGNPGDFHTIASRYCNGKTVHTGAYSGLLAAVSIAQLKSLFPSGNPTSFSGNEDGGIPQDEFGRPNTQPYAFTVRVLVSTASGMHMTGEDRRQLYLHRDSQMLSGWPKELQTDGDSTPILADIEGDDRPDLIVATSDGWISAYRPNGTEAPGWPVHTASLPLHPGEAAYGNGGVGAHHYQAVIGGLAAGDLFHNGQLDVVADDMGGEVYAWNGQGQLVFHSHSNPKWSGGPLDYPSNPVGALDPTRSGPRDRTEAGFLTAPVLANLRGGPGPLDIIVAGEDRHLYAWQPNGKPVRGFPVFVEDPDKLTAVNPVSNEPTFSTTRAEPNPGISEDQGKIIDTPAVAYVHGPKKAPVIYVGTNEEYTANTGDEGPINTSDPSINAIGGSGVLTFANGRVYAIKPTGGKMTCAAARCHSSAFQPGWPVKIGIIDEGLLPDVGEGINGSPVVAPITCTNGGGGMKIGVSPDAGPAYLLNQNGSSCYGSSGGRYNTLQTDASTGNGRKVDNPTFAAVGYPAFGTLSGKTISMFDQGAGLIRALDVAVNGEQKGGQDFILGWNASTGQFDGGYPAVANDLGFLTGETVGDITGNAAQQEVLGGTASLDVQAFNAAGQAASSAWPKLSGDWLVATPTLGPFGSLAYLRTARKDVVTITRSGTLSVYGTPAKACSPSSWPNWHHDLANSGDYTRDATPPGVPSSVTFSHRVLTFVAPGGDDECGRAATYQVVTSANPISPAGFATAHRLKVRLKPAAAGTVQHLRVPPGAKRYVAIRAVDAQGNLGLPAVLDTAAVQRHGRAASCAALGPVTHLHAASVSGGRVTLRGSSLDRSCGQAAIAQVRISLARASGRSCRFVQANGSLGPARSCLAPTFLNASALTRRPPGHLTTFRLTTALPAGHYTAVAIASDQLGRVELPTRWDRVEFAR
jgi:hypothetical protein